MKNIIFFTLFFISSFDAQSQSVVAYKKALPKIDAAGKITMPDGQVLNIENYSDTEGSVFVIVRHAEKDSSGTNADLIPIGRGRAVALRKILKKMPLTGVYSTDKPRTRHTAEPTAKSKGKTVELYDAKKQTELLTNLVAQKGKFLIVGHSNTVHQLVNTLAGNEQEKEFVETDYSRLYIVSKKKIGAAKVLMIRF